MKHLSFTTATIAAFLSATALWAGTAEDIAARAASFEAAFNSQDAAAVAAHYSEDGVILAPDTARIDGRAAIRTLWQAYVDAGVTDLELTTETLIDMGGTANEIGAFRLSVPDGNGGMVEARGKYVIIWKADAEGVWHLHWDIWNSSP